jgi:hypothetical protein
MVKLLDRDELSNLLPRFGNLVFIKTPDFFVRLKSVEGGYDREADDTGWWYWTSNALKFQYEIESVKRPKSMSIRFKYLCAAGRSINVLASRLGLVKGNGDSLSGWLGLVRC